MVNLRYHVVSLVAVFLALGIGVLMGATVIDRVTVDQLRKRLDSVAASVRQTRKENDRLTGQVRTWERFADQGRDQLLQGRLKGVPVLVLGVVGVDRKPVDELRRQLSDAQADVEGTLWLTPKMRLDNQGDADTAASTLGIPPDKPDVVRPQVVARLAAALDGGAAGAGVLPALRQAGFLGYDPPPASSSTTTTLDANLIPVPGTRLVVISGAGAQVDDDQVTTPLLSQMATAMPLVAAEAGQDTPGGRDVFVGFVRRDPQLTARVSTVDNLETFIGQTATILAVADLAQGQLGQFGVGPGAQRLLPPSPSAP
jgi:hypothetical protein